VKLALAHPLLWLFVLSLWYALGLDDFTRRSKALESRGDAFDLERAR